MATSHVLVTLRKPLGISSRAETCHRQIIDRGARLAGPLCFRCPSFALGLCPTKKGAESHQGVHNNSIAVCYTAARAAAYGSASICLCVGPLLCCMNHIYMTIQRHTALLPTYVYVREMYYFKQRRFIFIPLPLLVLLYCASCLVQPKLGSQRCLSTSTKLNGASIYSNGEVL